MSCSGLYQIDHGGWEENGEASNNFAEGNSLSSDNSGEDLTPVLETDEVGGVDHHSADEADTEEGERPLRGDEAVHDPRQTGGGEKYQERPPSNICWELSAVRSMNFDQHNTDMFL